MVVTIVLWMITHTRYIQIMFEYVRYLDFSDNLPTDANADQADSDDVSIFQVC